MKDRKRHHRDNAPGYSLAETLVSVFLVAVLLSILSAMFILLLRSYTLYNTKGELLDTASRIIERIGDAIRPAHGIEATRNIGGTLYTSGGQTIILKISSIDATGTPIAGAFDYLVLTPDVGDPTMLVEITDADAASSRRDGMHPMGQHISDIAFLYDTSSPADSTNVYCTLTVSQVAARTLSSFTFHTNATLRNR
jgi:hypothetical protein